MEEQKKTELVDAVMEQLLDGDHQYLAILREQYRTAEVDIEETGAGFFIEFEVSEEAETVPVTEDFHFGGVEVTMKGLSHGIGFVLFVRDGVIAELEGYTYEEPIPESIANLSVTETEERDPELLFPD
ncbi:hypothetical protein G3I44_13365 [Halogeometricum borinquense]|uniref:Uncharacterized protein n=1 Tax=Halogeometricum borinquense TaxID=60847 RepID=A0A6C0UI46_9EURY|nr:hypothetical protein [Halogeometricum borinquense]QIB75182.1 hypothetical protein G3I44_13365 [Halogeometricum borinquense]